MNFEWLAWPCFKIPGCLGDFSLAARQNPAAKTAEVSGDSQLYSHHQRPPTQARLVASSRNTSRDPRIPFICKETQIKQETKKPSHRSLNLSTRLPCLPTMAQIHDHSIDGPHPRRPHPGRGPSRRLIRSPYPHS